MANDKSIMKKSENERKNNDMHDACGLFSTIDETNLLEVAQTLVEVVVHS
jgi:hypothetical protein